MSPKTVLLSSEMRLAVMRLSRRLRQQRADHQLGFGQLSVLTTLERHGPQTAGALAAHEQVRPPSMTRTLQCLLDLGYVSRTPSPTDRRAVVVELTESARQLLLEDRRRRDQWLAERLRELPAHERETLAKALPLLEKLASQ